jgi:hypothetical protein
MGHNYTDRKIRKLRREHVTRRTGDDRQAADYAGVPLKRFLARGVAYLHVHCLSQRCSHAARLRIDMLIRRLGADFPTPAVKYHCRCSRCQGRNVDVMPSWPLIKGQGLDR